MCLAMPGRVESVRDEAGVRMGRIDFGGVVRDVCLACVPDIAVGEWALVHVGFALGR
ncbi:MAG: HypC/HybG/HupF family hydrogenase formation chaperone, partial [Planctomycetia bacterium]|nr:HypC/HybG/HupF family hydrogenase formation chaperone [Planctomycetia bacterium]